MRSTEEAKASEADADAHRMPMSSAGHSSATVVPEDEKRCTNTHLKRGLNARHVSLMTFSGVIGTGLFLSSQFLALSQVTGWMITSNGYHLNSWRCHDPRRTIGPLAGLHRLHQVGSLSITSYSTLSDKTTRCPSV